ncbi:MAG TPA: Tsi3 family protein [Myxococcaceae bacterium]
MTDLRAQLPVAGYALQLAPSYAAQVRGNGWTVAPASGGNNRREPVEISVDVITAPAPEAGRLENVGARRLRRTEETSAGGSSGEAVTVTYLEDLGPVHIRYQQVRYVDGSAPRFELDELIRRGGLLVARAEAGRP